VQVRDKKIVPEHATLFAEPGFREYLTPEEEWMTDYLLDSPFESPTLIITGRQDRVTGYQDAWDLIENIPRATFAVLDRASHFLSYCRALP
jgi:pimeloyl-ACP methyl ester carboxylesterase